MQICINNVGINFTEEEMISLDNILHMKVQRLAEKIAGTDCLYTVVETAHEIVALHNARETLNKSVAADIARFARQSLTIEADADADGHLNRKVTMEDVRTQAVNEHPLPFGVTFTCDRELDELGLYTVKCRYLSEVIDWKVWVVPKP